MIDRQVPARGAVAAFCLFSQDSKLKSNIGVEMARHNGGWLKLFRALKDHPAASDIESIGLLAWLLMNANHVSSRARFGNELIEIKAGQVITGRKEMAEKLRCSESMIERRLEWLKKCGTIEQRSNNHGRIITICNWSDYQSGQEEPEQPSDNERTAVGQPADSGRTLSGEEKKERKKEENKCSGKKPSLSFSEVDLEAAKWFQRQIKAGNPAARRVDGANLEEWANELRLMRERDGLDHERIAAVMAFALRDPFWSPNIQSPKKLREKWDTLTGQMDRASRPRIVTGGFKL